MSATSTVRRAVKRLRPTIRKDGRDLVRWMARHGATRGLLNALYSALGYEGKERFHNTFSYLFRDCEQTVSPGVWTVRFAGRPVRLPFGGRDTWLEWDAATAALGHDVDVKRTYENLLSSANPPRVVLDVGTNVGLHSLLFLVHGIRTVSFEPNPNCHDFIRTISALNGVAPDIRQVALGDRESEVELAFPPTETWLGTTVESARDRLSDRGELTRLRVKQTTLDTVCAAEGLAPDLIKIDTEGNELNVLRGAKAVLASARPLVVFESWGGEDRDALFGFMDNIGYRIINLPAKGTSDAPGLERSAFISSPATNFAALPHDRYR